MTFDISDGRVSSRQWNSSKKESNKNNADDTQRKERRFFSKIISQNSSCVFNHLMSNFKSQWTVQEHVGTMESIVEMMMIDTFIQPSQSSSEDES